MSRPDVDPFSPEMANIKRDLFILVQDVGMSLGSITDASDEVRYRGHSKKATRTALDAVALIENAQDMLRLIDGRIREVAKKIVNAERASNFRKRRAKS